MLRHDAPDGRGATILLPRAVNGRRHVFNQYVVRLPGRRDAVQRALESRGIGTAIYYPRPLHLQRCFASLGYVEGALPVAEQLARDTLAIPMFPELRPDERERVVEALVEAVRS